MDNPTSYHSTKRNLPLTGIVLSILVIGGIFSLTYFKLLPTRNTPIQNVPKPSISPLTKPPTISQVLTFQGCDIKKEGNPLVEDINTINNSIIGTFYGNINNFNLQQEATTSATIELISPKGEQIYDFNVKEESGLVYDGIAQKNLKLTDLKRGQTVVTSFNCFPKQNNLFKIARITVVGK